MYATRRFDTYRDMLAELGTPLGPKTVILDFGCGGGDLVKAARTAGLDAYGCDVDFSHLWVQEQVLREMKDNGFVRQIQMSPYRLPFDDASIDVVISDQVMEHVQDYNATIAELSRVMRPGAAFLHAFPSRYNPIEPHVFVPGATIIRHPAWLRLWATLGIRNPYQKGLHAAETARRNAEYLARFTNYLTPAQILRHFGRHSERLAFVEDTFLRFSDRGRILHQLKPVLPFLPTLYGLLRARFLYGVNRGAATRDA